MLLVSPEYFKRLKEEPLKLPNLKFKQKEHPYDRLMRLRELHDPILKKAQRLREPVALSLVDQTKQLRKLPIQTYKTKKQPRRRRLGVFKTEKQLQQQPKPKKTVQPRQLVTGDDYVDEPKLLQLQPKPKKTVQPRQLFIDDEYVDEPKLEEEEKKMEEEEGAVASPEDYYVPPEEMDEIEEHLQENVGRIASGYLSPYVHRRRYLDTEFGIRREDDGTFMIGDSPLTVDENGDIIIHGETFKGTVGLWELLTRKDVNTKLTTKKDLSTYKKILQLTNAHLEDNKLHNKIKTTRGSKFKTIISQLFPQKKLGLPRWTSYK